MKSSNSTNATRASLLVRAMERDQMAWRQMVDLYGPLVAQWCRGCGLDSATIADIVQEVFISLSKSIASFRSPPGTGAFRAWLWKMTRNKLIDWKRRSQKQLKGTSGSDAVHRMEDLVDPMSIPEDEPSSADALSELTSRALQQIKAEFQPQTWAAFWRSAVDGMPSHIIAEELGMSLASVRQARSRILRRFRAQLGDSKNDV
ncbi:MAG: sigma-70 family RNA polymerase sigma factor [Pirellulaceae bacterium]|nr:sigma-70 family RNA polymerase sigma factor [Pirellulaceae bacterium]